MKKIVNVMVMTLSLASAWASSSAKNSYLDEISEADIATLDLEKEDFEAVLNASNDKDFEKLDALVQSEVQEADSELEKMAENIDETEAVKAVEEVAEAKPKAEKAKEVAKTEASDEMVSDEVGTTAAAPVKKVLVEEPISEKKLDTEIKDDDIVGGSAPLFQ